jgi:monoamine oxidase
MEPNARLPPSRRSFLKMIGTIAGSAVMYRAMTALSLAGESGYSGPPRLSGDVKGSSVLILGAGLAGMSAAYELRKAGYKVRILEYNARPGGRNWTLYGGDTYTELGGDTQHVELDKGLYFNPGPWRIPHSHRAVLHYCQLLNVALEPFCQVNYEAYVHSSRHFGGRPQRYRQVHADFNGYVAELLAKCAHGHALDEAVSREDKEVLLEALRDWGALDKQYRYRQGLLSSGRRGFESSPGGGLAPAPVESVPFALSDLLQSQLWGAISAGHELEFQTTLFQPAGGMGMIGAAFGRELGPIIQYNAKVTDIHQDQSGVTVTYTDTGAGGPPRQARADWCVCTIPASILGQIPLNVGAPLQAAIESLAYGSSVKVGLQFKRRFWEEDEGIYGGITYTDQPNNMIGYPSDGFFTKKGVLLGAYLFGTDGYRMTAMTSQQRIAEALEQGVSIHPQSRKEFEHGVSVAWHRVPWTLGCAADWDPGLRARHYENLCALDGRIVLAGEHASRLPAWQEGAILSALDAVVRLHSRVMAR